jgi:hypothetical protein
MCETDISRISDTLVSPSPSRPVAIDKVMPRPKEKLKRGDEFIDLLMFHRSINCREHADSLAMRCKGAKTLCT